MTKKDAISWFKRTFGQRIAAALQGTPFTVDLATAIAYQETGYIWSGLVQRGLPESEVLRLCVGDTLDQDRGRSCFPRTRAELVGAPRGAEMFAIAREALLQMAQHTRGYENATINPNKFCHGFGIFQYDIQFFEENPDFFLTRSWASFEACSTQCLQELHAALARQGWSKKSKLTRDESVFVAIAYNAGTADCARGFKQGHESDGVCYGENIDEFLRIAESVPLDGEALTPAGLPSSTTPQPLFKKRGVVFEVVVQEGPLRLRSDPAIPAENPDANVLARLPKGHLVQRVSAKKQGEFLEVATTLDGAELRGFASAKYLRRVKRAIAVKTAAKNSRGRKGDSSGKAASRDDGSGIADQTKKKQAPASPVENAAELTTDMDTEALICAVQKALGEHVDGRAGPDTWKAIYFRVIGKKAATEEKPARLPASLSGTVDPRSEKNIATLLPEVRPYATALVLKAASIGITIKVLSGLRTYAEQDELYAQGRTKPGPIVTNARGGYSNHNFGIAFDVGVFKGASYLGESPSYKAVGALGVELGLDWGGNWKTTKDEPHFQLRPRWTADESERDMLAQLRARAESGQGVYA